MKRFFIIHRWAGGPEDDWRPWLKVELEKLGYEVHVPEMPGTETPVIEKWVEKITSVVGTPDAETYFIGHSIGCQAILRYLETVKEPVGGAIFVAGWFGLENLEDEDSKLIAKPWIERPIDLEHVKKVLPKSTLIISDEDPYGAFELNKKKFAEMGSKIVVLERAGHITSNDGFTELPEVLVQLGELL